MVGGLILYCGSVVGWWECARSFGGGPRLGWLGKVWVVEVYCRDGWGGVLSYWLRATLFGGRCCGEVPF